MNTTFKNILIFAAGTAVGGFGSYVYTKNIYEKILEEETSLMKEDLKEKLQQTKEKIIKDVEDMNEEVTASVAVEEKREVSKRERKNYSDIVRDNKYGDAVANSHNEEVYQKYERLSREAADHSEDRGPYVITQEQFNEEMNHFDKSTIYYYEDDCVLTDESEEVIQDEPSIVGYEALDCFGDGSGDPEIVYVRNEKLRIDYEVIRLSKSYSETVLGFEPGSYERKPRRRRADD